VETQNDIRYTKYEIPFDFAQGGEPVEPRTTNHHSRITTHQYLRLLAMVLLLACFAAFTPKAWARYSGGTGEPNDPYKIATAEDLNDIGNYEEDWDENFILVNDVNLAQYTGTQFKIIGSQTTKFTGVFDGNDHKILNFTWNSIGGSSFGLFRYLGGVGQIKNLGLENVDVNAVNGSYVGGLVGCNWYHGTITNCYSTGSVSGPNYVGGLVGYNDYGSTIVNCYSAGKVLGNWDVGGLLAENWAGTITDCYSTSKVDGNERVGGLMGFNDGPIFSNCYSTGSVSGTTDVGGLVGYNGGPITNCYSTGNVEGEDCVGGLVGNNSYRKITNCYSTGNITGKEDVGGLVGFCMAGGITDSFWDTETSGLSISAGGTPKTTAEMKTKSTFTDAGWDFVEVWGIGENQTYPFLLTDPTGDLNYDKKVDLIDLAILASHWLEEK